MCILACTQSIHVCRTDIRGPRQVTLTANDSSPELMAACKRGPFATPDSNEMLTYLLGRRRTTRACAEQHSVFHVISYQQRLSMVKHSFCSRGSCATPLGNTLDWWVCASAVCA